MRLEKSPAHFALRLFCLALLVLPWSAQAAPPNIILIMSDDVGYSDIGCYGSEIATPTLDALATGGVRFTQFYNTARCCPTRAALLTGLYAHQAGIGHMVDDWSTKVGDAYAGDLSKRAVTIAEALKPAGYGTYMVGKWHVTNKAKATTDAEKSNWPRQRGFDRFYGTIHGAGSFFDPNTLVRDNNLISPYADPEYQPRDFYYTDAINEQAARFVTEHQERYAEKPFFLYMAHTAAHWPMHAKESDIAKYRGKYDAGYDPIRTARLAKMKQLGLLDPRWQVSPQAGDWSRIENKAWESRCMEVYAAMLDCMDQGLGRLVDTLKKNGQYENTLILYLQDNGGCAEQMGRNGPLKPRAEKPTLPPLAKDYLQPDMIPKQTRDGFPMRQGAGVMPGGADTYIGYGRNWANVSNTPFREYKHWEHEGGISTPLIAHWPAGIARERHGKLEAQPSHLIDILATCMDVAAAKYPAEYNGQKIPPMEGVSLAPAFAGKPLNRPQPIFWEHEGNRAIRVGDWKLVSKHPGGWELYDIAADRTEMHDLAAQQPERVKEMSTQWDTWAKRVGVMPWPLAGGEAKRGEKEDRVMRILLLPFLLVLGFASAHAADPRPNIVMIFIDDMGWGDFSCFGNKDARTPNVDRLAVEGIRFSQFYVNSPICSPSRCALTTGQYPQRWRISSYLDNRAVNERRGVANWLAPQAPVLARFLQQSGYATGHFGKWHLGGQRDVGDAPLITEYGFDESLTNFEGLGPRLLGLGDAHNGQPPRRHALGSDKLGHGPVIWQDRSRLTESYTASAITFLDRAVAAGRPCYLNLWPDDVHSPFFPPEAKRSDASKRALYHAVLETMDAQLGVLFDHIRNSPVLRGNTLVVICSDNGPEPGAGSAGPFRGAKTTIYEGGIRSPLIVWPRARRGGKSRHAQRNVSLRGIRSRPFIPRHREHKSTGHCDLRRRRHLLYAARENRPLSAGADFLAAPAGSKIVATKSADPQRDLAVRADDWKLLCEYDGSQPELYNLAKDRGEITNLAAEHPEVVGRLTGLVLDWHRAMPTDNGATFTIDQSRGAKKTPAAR